MSFDGSTSADSDVGDTISYSWDLNGDGTFGDSTVAKPSFTYTAAGTYSAVLRVTDNHGASTASAPVTITVSSGGVNQPPVPTITAPASTLTWKVADRIDFSGSASDPEDGSLSASRLTWNLIIHHCDPTGQTCHIHPVQTFAGVSSGFFNAPDHGYPSYLELQLTATDSQGLTATTSVTLQPQVVNLTFTSAPTGLQLVFDGSSAATPFTFQAIIGSVHSISAPATQTLGGTNYTFSSWSDAGAATHNVTAPATDTTFAATYSGGGGTNHPPTAVATGSPTSGTAPLTVSFDGSTSADPDVGDTISYSWDLNGDGTFGDSTVATPSFTYTAAGTYSAVLRVTDNHGASTTSSPVTITVSSSGTSTFGTTTPGTLIDIASTDLKEVSKFTAPSGGSVVKLTGYVSGLGAGTGAQKVRAVLYADSGGNPGNLLGVSNEVTISAGRPWGWVDFTFPAQVAIQSGTVWMGYIAGSTGDLTQLMCSSVTNDLRYNTNAGGYAAGASNPFGSSVPYDFHYSMYATYIPSGGGTNHPPTAVATGSPASGTAPLTVSFDGSTSADPDVGDTISYSWDLNGDGTFGDSTVAMPSFTYTAAGTYSAVLRVTDNHGASTASAPVTITVSSGGGTGTFGTTTPGTLTDSAALNVKVVSKYTAPSAGNVVTVTGYLSGLGATTSSEKIKAIIYANAGGAPGSRLGVSSEVVINAKAAWAWVTFTFASPVAIPAGTIWIGYIAGGSKSDLIQMRYSQVAGDLRYNFNTYSAGPAATFGTAASADFHYSLYATYG